MNAQKSTRFRYILTCIDVFSRHVWLEKLRHKEAKDVLTAFKSILRRAGREPKRVLSDNGTEFAGAFEEFLKEREIKVSHSRPHQPQSNSLVERANQEVRRRLKALFIAQKLLTWHTRLPDIEANLNASYNSSIGTSPEHVYNADEDDPRVGLVRARLDKKARDKLAKFRDTEFAVGDRVRVSMQALFSSVRAKIKAGNRKSIIISFSPETYLVTRVIRPRDGGLTRWRYELGTENGKQLKKGKSEMAQFYASDLLHASEKNAGMSNNQALKLNQAQTGVGPNDVYIWGGNLYFDSV